MNSPHDQFTEVFPQLYDDLYKFLIYRVPHRADAEDLVAKTALTAWEKYAQYNASRGTLPEWVMGIAKNNVRMYWRTRRITCSLEEIECFLSDDNATQERLTSQHTIEQIFTRLSPEQKALLAMHYLDGMPYDEIAHFLKRTPTSVRKTVSRILHDLRTRFTFLIDE